MHYTDYESRISCLNLTLLHEWFSIDSPTPTSTLNLKKKHFMEVIHLLKKKKYIKWKVHTAFESLMYSTKEVFKSS
jgi:hypothetical protein